MSNYPPGAEYDSSAPYNQVDLSDIYGDSANDKIKEEIDGHDDLFIEWLLDNDFISTNYSDEELEDVCRDEFIRDEYFGYRFDDAVEELVENAADYYDYCREEAAEAARERRLLGED